MSNNLILLNNSLILKKVWNIQYKYLSNIGKQKVIIVKGNKNMLTKGIAMVLITNESTFKW